MAHAALTRPMWMKSLPEVAEELARLGVDLLREKTYVVGMADDAIEQGATPVDISQKGEVVREPERADRDRALAAGLSVIA